MSQISTQPYTRPSNRRQVDNNHLTINTLCYALYKGKRSTARRNDDAARPYYIDRYESWIGVNVILIACLSALDSFFTLQILASGGTEVNPVMQYLLEINTSAFIFGKMAMTSICLVFVMIHINFKLLGIVSIRSLLISIASIYVLLIGYEIVLLSTI